MRNRARIQLAMGKRWTSSSGEPSEDRRQDSGEGAGSQARPDKSHSSLNAEGHFLGFIDQKQDDTEFSM